jgi:hypothetical protein
VSLKQLAFMGKRIRYQRYAKRLNRISAGKRDSLSDIVLKLLGLVV